MKLWGIYKRFPYLEYRHRLVANLPQNASLLEVGSSSCDRAKLFKFMRPDLNVYATDVKDFSASAGSEISFFMADITKGLPEEFENKFDCVTAMHVFEHLAPRDYDSAIDAIKKVLKQGGTWYIETPGIRSLFFPSFSLGRKQFHCPLNFYDDPSHVRPFSKCGLYFLLKDHGFEVKRTGTARNMLFLLSSPLLVLAGILFCRRLWLAIGLCNLFGWSVFGHGVMLRKERNSSSDVGVS